MSVCAKCCIWMCAAMRVCPVCSNLQCAAVWSVECAAVFSVLQCAVCCSVQCAVCSCTAHQCAVQSEGWALANICGGDEVGVCEISGGGESLNSAGCVESLHCTAGEIKSQIALFVYHQVIKSKGKHHKRLVWQTKEVTDWNWIYEG